MKKIVELPIDEPIYNTHNFSGSASAIFHSNPSIKNWYLNQIMMPLCNKDFLYRGMTTPQMDICYAFWDYNPYLEKKWYSTEHLNGYVHPLIRALLDDGFYVAFQRVDDYYVCGKSWYKKRHFIHDGLICGYDQIEKTYSILAYDQNWVYRVFKTPQKAFEAGRKSAFRQGIYTNICGLKPKSDIVELNPAEICANLKDYLASSLEKYPLDPEAFVGGIMVHDYIAMYLDKLIDGSIPYERMDWRVFHLIWNHKTVMLERIRAVESKLLLGNGISEQYSSIVKEANHMRMLYASHHAKRRDSILPVIRKELIHLREQEEQLLTEFINKVEGALGQ